ncbi:MAG: InlB B-repeat-containing protein [Clostridia bacterium]|nr:InlB B-repeat-containing protein [Clostridia bacterium]
MKNKKILKALTALVMGSVTALAGFAAACDPVEDNGGGHTHNYTWVDDENGTTHHEHCTADGCDAPDKAAENHTWNGDECSKCHAVKVNQTDNAIVPEYKGEAAGPEAGEKDITSLFKASDLEKGTLSEAWTNGVVSIPGGTELRDRKDTTNKYTRSVKNGVITINVPASGTLKISFASGSSTIGNAGYKLTKADNTVEEVAINTGDKVLNDLELEVVKGTYKFQAAKGTVDVFAIELKYKTTAAPIEEIEITSAGTTDYLVTQKVDCTGVALVAKDANGVLTPVKLENCKFDTSKYNPKASGEYEISVTYFLSDNLDSQTKEFTATYKVKVYMVDSIELSTIGLSSNKQVTVQQAYLPDGSFNSNSLSVVANCSFGGNTIKQKLKDSWYTVTAPNLAEEGAKTVTVYVDSLYTVGNKSVSASYEVAVKAKKAVAENKVEVTVGETGEFKTLTQAVQYLKACNYESGVNKVIKLQAGTYTEKVWLDIDNVTLVGLGENIDDTKLSYSLVEGDADALSGSLWALNCATLHVTGKNFKAYNLAVRNDFDYMKNSGNYSGTQAAQGVALTLDADGAVLYKCHLYGNQDTLYMKSGRSYYYQSQIDGNIDFIFGGENSLAYFDDCKIVAINRESKTSDNPQNGYVTAAKHTTDKKPDYGYIFNNCELTDDGSVNAGAMSLGRPWGEKATVAYIGCSFSDAYSQEGTDGSHKIHRWNDWSTTVTAASADFREYGSTDAQGNPIMQTAVAGGSVLTQAQAANYTKTNLFGTANGKVGYTTEFDSDTEYSKLRILAGIDSGELPEETKITVDLQDAALPNGSCVEAINQKYSEYITWTGTGVFEAAKPQNGVKIGTDTVITVNVVGEVSLVAGYELPVSDYVISYNEGKATIKVISTTGTYGSYIGSIIIDTSKTPEDTQTVDITVDYNDGGATVDGTLTAIVGSPLAKPADPVREGYKFVGWKVNGSDYNFTQNVTEAFTLVAQWEVANDFDLTSGGTVNLYEFTTGQVQGNTAVYRGIIIDATASGAKFAPRSNDVQVNAGVKIKFKINAGTTADKISVSFTAAAGDSYIPTVTVDVEAIDGSEYAVITITNNSYPSTMTVTINA